MGTQVQILALLGPMIVSVTMLFSEYVDFNTGTLTMPSSVLNDCDLLEEHTAMCSNLTGTIRKLAPVSQSHGIYASHCYMQQRPSPHGPPLLFRETIRVVGLVFHAVRYINSHPALISFQTLGYCNFY